MGYQYPPQQGGFPPQPPQPPQFPQQPAAPQPPAAPVSMNVGGIGVNVPIPGAGNEMGKVGFFGTLAFYLIGGMVFFGLMSMVFGMAEKPNLAGPFGSFAGHLGQGGIILLGLSIVSKLLDKKS